MKSVRKLGASPSAYCSIHNILSDSPFGYRGEGCLPIWGLIQFVQVGVQIEMTRTFHKISLPSITHDNGC